MEEKEKEKPSLTIVEPSEIPKKGVGRKGKNWLKLLSLIPKGKVWKLSEDNKDYKLSSVKAGVKVVNEEAKKELFKAEQRTIDEKVFLFVTRI